MLVNSGIAITEKIDVSLIKKIMFAVNAGMLSAKPWGKTLERDFSMYSFYTSIVECKNVVVPKNADFSIDVDRVIETANREHARMIVFSNPCNPTSLVLKREEVRRLITSVSALVVLDEAYMDFSSESLLSEFSEYDNLLILKTCSKAIGMAAQ